MKTQKSFCTCAGTTLHFQYIGLVTGVLQFLNTQFLNTNNSDVKDYLKNSLNESHMTHLAAVIKDLDKEQPTAPESEFLLREALALAKRFPKNKVVIGCGLLNAVRSSFCSGPV